MSVGAFILGTLQKAWEKWNLRMFILLSMTLQIILIFFAPFRKRSSNVLIIFSVWTAYLLADWAAAYCVGLISKNQNNKTSSSTGNREDLFALWAPFLLLHLGGPDPITAFALEDNALWIRHLLSLLLQVAAAAYVFYQTLPKNHLLGPTILMFVAGIIKYVERTTSLYLASLKSFKYSMLPKPDPGPNYAKLMDEYASRKEAHLPARIEIINEPKKAVKSTYDSEKGDLSESDAIKHAYYFFNIFKGLIVDLIFSFKERNESRLFFLDRTPDDAMKVIAIELNFMYEVLFTKVRVVHSYVGYGFRCVAASSVVLALALFYYTKDRGLLRYDVIITYILLGAAIFLELIALCMIIFSDWTVANIKGKAGNRVSEYLRKCLGERFLAWNGLEVHRPFKSTMCCIRSKFKYDALDTSVIFRRWSESVPAFNLLSYCLEERPESIVKEKGTCAKVVGTFFWLLFYIPKMLIRGIKYLGVGFFGLIGKALNFVTCSCTGYIGGQISRFVGFLSEKIGLQEILEDMKYVTRNPFIKDIWKFIFEELKDKSLIAEDAETARRICESRGEWVLRGSSLENRCAKLMKYVVEVEYDRSILLWHVATELCYHTDDNYEAQNDHREFSKIISDYMLYLLVKQATMLSAVAGIGMIRYQDTCAEVRKFFGARRIEGKDKLREACEMILDVDTSVDPVDVKGDRSKSVVFDACILAKCLKEMKKEMWEVTFKVWVEKLSYGASHCRAETHAQMLSKGGELNTFVWLLMAHLGLGEQFQINEGHARAKLLVKK